MDIEKAVGLYQVRPKKIKKIKDISLIGVKSCRGRESNTLMEVKDAATTMQEMLKSGMGDWSVLRIVR